MSQEYRSAYVRMCQKRNDDRKELINKIKRVDLIIMYLSIRPLGDMVGIRVAYRDGLIEAFRTAYGYDETVRLWEYLDKRRKRVARLLNHMLKV